MTVIVQRSCASSNRVDDEKIAFNSFSILMTNTHAARFAMIHRYMFDNDKFDRVEMVRTLEEIIDVGMFEMAQNIKTLTARREEQ